MNLARACAFALMVGAAVLTISPEVLASSWQCSTFSGSCPEGACSAAGGNRYHVWPSSCGTDCVCDQVEIAFYRMHPEYNTCVELCDYGYDGWCDCQWLP